MTTHVYYEQRFRTRWPFRAALGASLAATVAGALWLGACAETPSEPSADSVATFRGGEISLAEVESRMPSTRTENCRTVRRARGSAPVDLLIPCYRDVARSLALEHLISSSVPDLEYALHDLGDDYWNLRTQAYLAPLRLEMRRQIEITDEEVGEYFAAHREDYSQPARVTLWNIFRRHENSNRREDTLKYLAGLKSEYESGRPFDHLAREHSQSETRLRGGLVGSVAEGDLPDHLEQVVFALEEGEVSDPVLVRGGAVLLQARSRIPGISLELDAVAERVRRDLVQQRIEQAMAERAANYQPSEDDLVLDEQQLVAEMDAALEAGDDNRIVLALGDARLGAAGLRRAGSLESDQPVHRLDDAAREDLLAEYDRQYRLLAVAAEVMASADEERRRRAEDGIRTRALPLLVDRVLREEMTSAVDSNPDALKQYFEDHRAHYQSDLRFDLRVWDLPFGDDPPEQLRQMEQVRRDLVAGKLELEEAVGALGGSIRDLGWMSYADLSAELPNKAQEYLLADSSSFSVPFQQDEALHLIHMQERKEPGPVEYNEVAEQVRDDYLERFEQRAFDEAADRRLSQVDFDFREQALRGLLAADRAST